MNPIDVFGPKLSTLIILVGAGYFLLSFAPVIWRAWLAFRRKPRMSRPWLFIGIVAVVVYGLFSFLGFALLIPVELYGVFVAPSLESANVPYGVPRRCGFSARSSILVARCATHPTSAYLVGESQA